MSLRQRLNSFIFDYFILYILVQTKPCESDKPSTKYINEESLEVTRTVPLNLTWSGLGMKRQLSFSFGIPSLSISGSQASPSPAFKGTVRETYYIS